MISVWFIPVSFYAAPAGPYSLKLMDSVRTATGFRCRWGRIAARPPCSIRQLIGTTAVCVMWRNLFVLQRTEVRHRLTCRMCGGAAGPRSKRSISWPRCSARNICRRYVWRRTENRRRQAEDACRCSFSLPGGHLKWRARSQLRCDRAFFIACWSCARQSGGRAVAAFGILSAGGDRAWRAVFCKMCVFEQTIGRRRRKLGFTKTYAC